MRPYNYNKQGDYDHYVVDTEAPLLEWLLGHLQGYSRSKVKATLKGRGIRVNGKQVTQFDQMLKPGDKVAVSLSKKNDQFHSRFLKLVYEDRYLVVVEKKEGILSMAPAIPVSMSRRYSMTISALRGKNVPHTWYTGSIATPPV